MLLQPVSASVPSTAPVAPLPTDAASIPGPQNVSSMSSPPPVDARQLPAQDRPRLTPPPPASKRLSELRYLEAMSQFRDFGEEIIAAVATRLESAKFRLQEFYTENAQKLKEAAERASASGFWDLLKKVATCLLSALSVVIGISLVSTTGGALIGGAMIASGLLSIANFTFSEAGIWNWVATKLANEDEERRKQIAFLLPAAVGVASALTGIFGSVSATLSYGVSFMDKALFIAQTGLVLFESVTTIGKGYSDARQLWAQADLLRSSAQMAVQRHLLDNITSWTDDLIKELGAARQKVSQLVRLCVQANQTVVKELHG